MKTWFVLGDIIALVLLLFILDTSYQTMATQQEQYNEIRLSRAVEYAAEAAFSDSIGASDSGLSYLDSTTGDAYNVPMTTQNTLKTFETVLAYSYGFTPSDEVLATIEDSIGTMLLACTDGYYAAERMQTEEDGTGLMWTIKKPYSYEFTTSDGQYVTYGLTLNTESFIRVAVSGRDSVESYSATSGLSYADTGGEVTDEIRRTAVSRTLTDAMEYYMGVNTDSGNSVSIYLPSTQTLSGINQIAAPTLLVIMDDCTFAGVTESGSAALTGDRLIKKVRVIGYYRKGLPMYSYEYQGALEDALDSGTSIQYFDTIEEAAAAGYGPDLEYLFNEISYDRTDGTSSGSGDYSSPYASYDITKDYQRGDYVTYQGTSYICTKDTSGVFDSSCWKSTN